MSECGDAMSNRGSLRRMPMIIRGVLVSLTRLFVSREVLLLSVLLADTMSMRGAVLQFRGFLVVLVVRSVVIASRHN